jgi:hypothetical protein
MIHMNLFIGNAAIDRHIDTIGRGGEGRSRVAIAGNAALAALKAALAKAGVADELRAPIISHFVHEWNAGVESGALRI